MQKCLLKFRMKAILYFEYINLLAILRFTSNISGFNVKSQEQFFVLLTFMQTGKTFKRTYDTNVRFSKSLILTEPF